MTCEGLCIQRVECKRSGTKCKDLGRGRLNAKSFVFESRAIQTDRGQSNARGLGVTVYLRNTCTVVENRYFKINITSKSFAFQNIKAKSFTLN